MSLNPDDKTVVISQFKGSMLAQDDYLVDLSHSLYNQNCDFVVTPTGEVMVTTRRGTSQVAQLPNSDGGTRALFGWYFINGSIVDSYAVYYSPTVGVRGWSQSSNAFSSLLMSQTGAFSATFIADGLRLYAAFVDSSSKIGFAGGQVYGLGIGADPLFAAPLQTSIATVTPSQPGAGVITAGTHRFGYVFTTRNGYSGALNPVDINGVFVPQSFTAADGVHNLQVVINFISIPSYLAGGTIASVQICMAAVANPARLYLIPGMIANVPAAPGSVTLIGSINDNDLVTGTEVTGKQNLLTQFQGGGAPFKPSAIFEYSSRFGYCTFDASGFPVVYFSDQNAFQSLTAAFHGIYLEGRQIPIQGCSLGGVCFIGTSSGLYATQDNGGQPVTWIPPAHVDGSVGILAASCMLASGGKVLLASEKGLFLFRGGTFPDIPLSYWQSPDWNRINWANAAQVQIIDSAFDKKISVIAPLKVIITGATNTNPISITVGILVDNLPIVNPHLFQTGLSVTIAGVGGNTNANGTFTITVTGNMTFTIPVAGNGAYTGGGVATPNSPNAEMTWSYPDGDAPGYPFYSIQAFSAYRMGGIGIIRNINTGVDETWYSPGQSNPGGILRRNLPTDTLIYRDQDLSGSATAINSYYQTALAPGGQDTSTVTHRYDGAHLRVSGNGQLALVVNGVDYVQSTTPRASPLTLSAGPGTELLVKWDFWNEQESLQFGTNAVDAFFVMALIKLYYTNLLPMR